MDCGGNSSEEGTPRCVQQDVAVHACAKEQESDGECSEVYGRSSHAYGVEPLRSMAAGRERYLNMAERLSCIEAEADQTHQDLDLVRNDGTNHLKQRLVDLTKKNRKLHVTVESQKSKIQHFESELHGIHESVQKRTEKNAQKHADMMHLNDGVDDSKSRYLVATKRLQDIKTEVQELKLHLQRQKKALIMELGSEEAVEKALTVVDDPHVVQWRGRATQLSQLQRQMRQLSDQLGRPSASLQDDPGISAVGDPTSDPLLQQRPQRIKVDPLGERAVAQAAEKRREEFEKLQDDTERLRREAAEMRRRQDALRSRNAILEGQLRELKTGIQDLLRKRENDNLLVAALQDQLHRHGAAGRGTVDDVETMALQHHNSELRGQLERQAQILVHLNKRSPTAVDPQVVERVRFLEAENARQYEQVRLLRERDPGRPLSADRHRHVSSGPGPSASSSCRSTGDLSQHTRSRRTSSGILVGAS